MIIGHLDEVSNHVATGWALDSSKLCSAADIAIKINGNIVAVGRTGGDRPDVYRLHRQNNTGFKIPIPASCFYDRKKILVEAFIGGARLSGAVTLPPTTFFIHVPKTGGSTLRKMLDPFFEDHLTFPDTRQLRRRNGLYPPMVKGFIHESELNLMRFIRGHFGWTQIELLETRPQIVTVLRDPVERMVSQLKHQFRASNTKQNPESFQSFLDRKADQFILRMRNLQCRMLGETRSDIWYRSDKVNLDLALSRLAEIDHLFFTDTLDSASEKFRTAWGVQVQAVEAVNRSVLELNVPEDLRAKIRDLNEFDVALHKAARLRF